MTSQAKGAARESELVNKFQDAGWFARRAGGSGAGKNESYDVIAAEPSQVYVAEVKYNGQQSKYDYMYVETKEVAELCYVSWFFDAEPLLVGRWAQDTTFYGWSPKDVTRAGPNDDGNFKLEKEMQSEAIELPPYDLPLGGLPPHVDESCPTCGQEYENITEKVYHEMAVDCG